jgi:hypothetical protein
MMLYNPGDLEPQLRIDITPWEFETSKYDESFIAEILKQAKQ